jgi:hypothetical protein
MSPRIDVEETLQPTSILLLIRWRLAVYCAPITTRYIEKFPPTQSIALDINPTSFTIAHPDSIWYTLIPSAPSPNPSYGPPRTHAYGTIHIPARASRSNGFHRHRLSPLSPRSLLTPGPIDYSDGRVPNYTAAQYRRGRILPPFAYVPHPLHRSLADSYTIDSIRTSVSNHAHTFCHARSPPFSHRRIDISCDSDTWRECAIYLAH